MRYAAAAITFILSLAGGLALRWWIGSEPDVVVEPRLPAATAVSVGTLAPTAVPLVPGDHCNRLQTVFTKLDGLPGNTPGRWSCFRGDRRDNIVRDTTPLADAWPPEGPPVLWSVTLGDGHAGPAVYGGCVYVLDYDETYHGDVLRAFSLDDGTECWNRRYPVRTKRNHGMSRTVPAVNEQYIVTIGPQCHVMCVSRETGELHWGLDLVLDYGTTVPLWYTAQCPLLNGDTAIIAPAGRLLMMAVDCRTGDILWEVPNPDGWKMSHSSVMPMQFSGKPMYVYCALGGIVAVSADREDAGRVLWKTNAWNKKIVAPSPVQLDGQRILVTAGHGAGSMVLEISQATDGEFEAKVVRAIDKTEFACEQQTPLVYGDRLYSILPKDAGEHREELVAAGLDFTRLWTSGSGERFGLGPFIIADRKLYILEDRGELVMASADTDRFEVLGRTRPFDGRDAWGPLVIAGGRLLMRDSTRMLCLDISEKTE